MRGQSCFHRFGVSFFCDAGIPIAGKGGDRENCMQLRAESKLIENFSFEKLGEVGWLNSLESHVTDAVAV